MTCPSARGIDPFSCRERTAIRLATSRKKLSELPPDQLRFHQTSKSQAKELKGARFPASRPPQKGSRRRNTLAIIAGTIIVALVALSIGWKWKSFR